MSEWKLCPKCHCMNLNRESCVDCWCDLREVVAPDANGGSIHRVADPIPTVLFCGEAVWRELNDKERTLTTASNVSDVLDAVVRLMRREARQNDQTET